MNSDVYNAPEPVLPGSYLAARRAHLLDEIDRRSSRHWRVVKWFVDQPRRRRMMLVVALVIVLGGVGTALGLGLGLLGKDVAFHKRYDRGLFTAKPVSSFVYITRGTDWALIAWKSNRGICLDYAYEDTSNRFGFNGWSACGMPVVGSPPDKVFKQPPNTDLIGISMGSGNGVVAVSGPVAASVTKVRILLRDGKVFDPTIYAAPAKLHTSLRFYLLRVPSNRIRVGRPTAPAFPGEIRAVLAFGPNGTLLQRKDLP
jgi:hypothetical protein